MTFYEEAYMAGRKLNNERDARACLEAAERSGLDRAGWAREHGIDARSLNAWRLNLAREDGAAFESLGVVELVPIERRGEYTLVCGQFRLNVGSEFDERVVSRLLAAMAAAC